MWRKHYPVSLTPVWTVLESYLPDSGKEIKRMEEPQTQRLALVKSPYFIIRNLKLFGWNGTLLAICGKVNS